MQSSATVTTRIWCESPTPDLRQSAEARCHGYDVFDQMLGRCSSAQMQFLLFMGELPTPRQLKLFELLAVALANPGPREASVHAAMCAGVSRSPQASWLSAALTVAAGRYGGAMDVNECMTMWATNGPDLAAWRAAHVPREAENIWPACSYPAGFADVGPLTGPLVRQTLSKLAEDEPQDFPLMWLYTHYEELQAFGQGQIAFSFVAAMTFATLGMTPQQGELMYLLFRLPGAGAHALEQSQLGHRAFPFPPGEKLPVPGQQELAA